MKNAICAEFFLMRKRPVGFVIALLWILMSIVFVYVIPTAVLASVNEPEQTEVLKALISLPELPVTTLSGYPLFGIAMFIILGGCITGAEFGWDTWKIRFTQGPTRTEVIIAKFLVSAIIVATIVTVTDIASAIASFGLSQIAHADTALPNFGPMLLSWLAAIGIAVAACWFGMMLSVLTKSTAFALSAGLLFALALDAVVTWLSSLWEPISYVQKITLGKAVTSLSRHVIEMGGETVLTRSPVPANVEPLWAAILVICCYAVVSIVVSTVVMRSRDVD